METPRNTVFGKEAAELPKGSKRFIEPSIEPCRTSDAGQPSILALGVTVGMLLTFLIGTEGFFVGLAAVVALYVLAVVAAGRPRDATVFRASSSIRNGDVSVSQERHADGLTIHIHIGDRPGSPTGAAGSG
jgi:hypothetical protein